MLLQHEPTVGETIHHDWGRKFFSYTPEDPLLDEHLDQDYVRPGTTLDLLGDSPNGFRDAILVAREPTAQGKRRRLVLWHGAQRIQEETFYGLFGQRFQKISSAAFGLILQRATHFFIRHPETNPTFVFPLPQFARFGVSVRVLEEILDAPVQVPMEGLYARNSYVPSLRVYANYDGNRYGDSTRKLFYDQRGNAVPVELVARDALHRFGYQVVSPSLFHKLFLAVVGRPVSHFAPDAWPTQFLSGRISPLEQAARAEERIEALRDAGILRGIIQSLEALAERYPYKNYTRPDGALPLVSRHLTRRKLELFLETVGENRMLHILRGFLRGYKVISADWFAYMEGSNRVFPCEVKARGDHLRPYQKESILYCQRNGLLDYRLLELLHTRPAQSLNAQPELVPGAP
jgi:hypothetical protein